MENTTYGNLNNKPNTNQKSDEYINNNIDNANTLKQTIDLKNIYSSIKNNDDINKRISLIEIENKLKNNEDLPNIKTIDDIPKENNIELISKLSVVQNKKTSKPWITN